MQRYLACVSGCLAVILSTAGSECMASDVPSASDLQALGLEVRWNSQAVLDAGRDVVAFVTNDESNIYVQSSAGVLTVFNAENGRKLWAAQIGRQNEPASAATANKDTFVVVVGPVIYGFNKFTGVPVFEQRLAAPPSSSPIINEDALFVPITGGAVYAYSLGVLEYKYRYGTLPDTQPRPFLWRFVGNEEIIRPLVLGEKALAFATEAGNLHSIAIRGVKPGSSEFQMQLNEPATAPLAIASNESSSSVIMLTGDNMAFSVDLLKGSTEWAYPIGRPMEEAPIVIGDAVYIVTTEGTLTRITRNSLSPDWGRPVEIPLFTAPVYIGAGIEEVQIDEQIREDLNLPGVTGLLVKSVEASSTAIRAGVQQGDIIVSIDGISVASVEEVKNRLVELAKRVERPIGVIRDGQLMELKIAIPVKQWDVRGLEGVTAIGRFSVYGIDKGGRLVAIDKQSAELTGRVSITGFEHPHHNYITDQIYFISNSGDVVCLREIGPTITVPEISSVSKFAKVVSVMVKAGDPVEETGTVLCEIELPDGSVVPISAAKTGTIRSVFVKAGQTVAVGDSVALIADDQFATYYRNPDQRPIDVPLNDPNAVQPEENE